MAPMQSENYYFSRNPSATLFQPAKQFGRYCNQFFFQLWMKIHPYSYTHNLLLLLRLINFGFFIYNNVTCKRSLGSNSALLLRFSNFSRTRSSNQLKCSGHIRIFWKKLFMILCLHFSQNICFITLLIPRSIYGTDSSPSSSTTSSFSSSSFPQ